MRKIVAVSAALFCWIVAPALSQDKSKVTDVPAPQASNKNDGKPEFEFRGHKIGEEISFKSPRWNKSGNDRCYSLAVKEILLCDDKAAETKSSGITYRKVGDVYITHLTYMFFDNKLFSLNMSFGSDDFLNIRAMLTGKYGDPSREKRDVIKNMAGASFDKIITEWDFKEGVLRLTMRDGKIDTSWLKFENPEALSLIGQRIGAANEAKGKSAF